MNKTQYLPSLLIAISVAASIVYMVDGDWRKAVYWFSAATLNFAVTF